MADEILARADLRRNARAHKLGGGGDGIFLGWPHGAVFMRGTVYRGAFFVYAFQCERDE